MDDLPDEVESLAFPEARARLPFHSLLRIYLDPFALFKSVTVGTPAARAAALEYNRRQRRILLVYARRWALIAAACLFATFPISSWARSEPLLYLPAFGLEIGFSLAFCMVLLSATVYFLLSRRSTA